MRRDPRQRLPFVSLHRAGPARDVAHVQAQALVRVALRHRDQRRAAFDVDAEFFVQFADQRAFGRLVGTQDANGHRRSNTLDEAGRLQQSTDALGNGTNYAYDALGNQVFTQNALGYITLKQYDRLNRTTAIGDFMPNAAATARTRTLRKGLRHCAPSPASAAACRAAGDR